MSPRVSLTFIIPVRNDSARLARCLRSIGASTVDRVDIDVIVADNGSSDDSAEVARSSGAQVLCFPGLPVATLRNEAAGLASGQVLGFVDADHEISSSWCEAAVDALSDERVGATGAPCYPPRDANWVQVAYDRFRVRPQGPADVEWLGAGNMAVRASVFAAIGGFDTRLETCEDVDLCNRLRRAGYRIRHEARMFNIHYGDPASLRAVFMGELWRGRDNARVTLRGPLSLRSLPSLVIPAGNLALLLTGALAAAFTGNAQWLLLPVMSFAAATLLRIIRMSQQDGVPLTPAVLLQNGAVAGVYEAARGVALMVRASHRARRREQ